jgi:uncharacterized protein (TIGR03435 family)
MRLGIHCAGLLALTMCAARAQTPEASPAFDVASVKPAAPMTGGRIMVRMSGGPGTPDPGQLTYTNVALKNILTAAYNVKGYQISGPGWLDSERFDIVAKIPKGATKEQFQLMLQNLLSERFKLKLHRETKDLPIYALVVAKNGPKMKESPKDDPEAGAAAEPPPLPPGGPLGDGPRIKIGKDGMPQLPPGMGRGGRGGMMMMMNGSRMRLQASKQPVSAIAEMLGNQLGRPVVDKTDLKANYDYTLDFAPDESMRPPGMMGAMPPPPPTSPDGGAFGGPSPNSSDGPGGPSLMTALQEQLGLKLEPRKGPIDLLVIDSLEKVPTEN